MSPIPRRPGRPGITTRATGRKVSWFSDSLAYVSDAEDGLYIIRFDGTTIVRENDDPMLPKTFVLDQNYPNPFNPSTTIPFEIPSGAGDGEHIRLAIYSARGRLIRTLVDSELESGTHQVVWDGKDGAGQPVSSGIYLYTLSRGDVKSTRKMVIQK